MLTEEKKVGKCEHCGRKLTDPESVERHVGPVCLRKRATDKTESESGLIPPEYHGEIILEDLPTSNPVKTYHANRGMMGVRVTVDFKGRTYHLPHIAYHSPSGYEWGYSGSGPADLARSILADCAGMKVAGAYYQSFKWDFIAAMPKDGFVLPETAIREWLEEKVKG